MRNDELMELVREHETWLKTDGEAGDRLVLQNEDLTGSNLENRNLRFSILQGSDLSESNLNGTNLAGADLRKAVMVKCQLNKTSFAGSFMCEAILDYSIGTCANFEFSSLAGASLYETRLCDSNFTSCDLTGCDLRFSDLRGSTFERADLEDVNLLNAYIRGCKFEFANLTYIRGFTDPVMDPMEYLNTHYTRNKDGYIVYAVFDRSEYDLNFFKLKPGGVLRQQVDYDRNKSCGSGLRVGTKDYIRSVYQNVYITPVWECLIYNTNLISYNVTQNSSGWCRRTVHFPRS